MKLSTLAAISSLATCVLSSAGADATSPIDYTQRNRPYAPGESVPGPKRKPEAAVQAPRIEKGTVEKRVAPLREREAPVEVQETRPKHVRDKVSARPEAMPTPKSEFDQRSAGVATNAQTIKPPLVAKYQDSLAAAPTWPGVRPLDPAATTKINRFVFRKNPPEPTNTVNGSPVVPAAGGSNGQK